MPLSHYQEAILDRYTTTRDNLVINACPGSGKTFTLNTLWDWTDSKAAYLVFNKANADEAKARFGEKEQSFLGTLNSFGARIIYGSRHGLRLNKNKVRNIIHDRYPFTGDKYGKYKQEDLHKLVMLCKSYCSSALEDIEALREQHDIHGYHGIECDSADVYHISLEDRETVDFADQLLWPVVHNLPKPQYKDVLIDESQDLSRVQRLLIEGIGKRYVFVGDKRQAIYGFRGAASGSLDEIAEQFHCIALPLKLTYRCSKAIVKEAQLTYPDDIEALANATNGIVRESQAALGEDYSIRKLSQLIVCRNNAPLIEFAYSLLKKRIPVQMVGRDFGKNLTGFIKRLGPDSLTDLEHKLDLWRYEQESIAVQHNNSDKLQSIADKYDTIHAFIGMCASGNILELYEAIEALFSADYGVRLATVHRAKGLEADRVYFLKPSLIPSQYAKSLLATEQEHNIKYVGVTRAKEELVYLP